MPSQRSHNRKLRSLGALAGVSLALAGCGSDDSSSEPAIEIAPLPTAQGVFVDSPVKGLEYYSAPCVNHIPEGPPPPPQEPFIGLTGEHGEFEAFANCPLWFSVGDIGLGSSDYKTVVTPLDLAAEPYKLTEPRSASDPRVINVIRLLQTIDADSDPSNGIDISEQARALAKGVSLNFDQGVAEFASDPAVLAFVAGASNGAELVGSEAAQAHFNASLAGLMTFQVIDEGSHSGIQTPINGVIRDQSAWDGLWQQHSGLFDPPPVAPAVDFSQNMVVALFGGQRPSSGYQLSVVEVVESATAVTVHFVERQPGPEDVVLTVITHPYALVAIPFSDKEVSFSQLP